MSEIQSSALELLARGECAFQMSRDSNPSFLHIPPDKFLKAGGSEGIRALHIKVFQGAAPLGGEQFKEIYVLELPSNVEQGKVQELIGLINNPEQ